MNSWWTEALIKEIFMLFRYFTIRTVRTSTTFGLVYFLLCSSAVSYGLTATKTSAFPGKQRFTTADSVDSPGEKSIWTDRVKTVLGNQPISFEINRGQMDRRVKFLLRGQGYSLFLTAKEAVLALTKEDGPKNTGVLSDSKPVQNTVYRNTLLRMKLAGADSNPRIEGAEQVTEKANYFIGKILQNGAPT